MTRKKRHFMPILTIFFIAIFFLSIKVFYRDAGDFSAQIISNFDRERASIGIAEAAAAYRNEHDGILPFGFTKGVLLEICKKDFPCKNGADISTLLVPHYLQSIPVDKEVSINDWGTGYAIIWHNDNKITVVPIFSLSKDDQYALYNKSLRMVLSAP